MEKKKILICGAGSVGIFLGAKLYSKNHEVYLFGRRKLKEAGDEEVIINGEKYKIPKRKFTISDEGDYDFIFITSKLYDLEKMIEIISRNKINGKIISSIQNGLVDNSRFREILNKNITSICVFEGFKIEKNKIFYKPTPIGWKTEPSKEGKEVSNLISSCGISCDADNKFDSLRAEKMIVNCCLNALSAIEKKHFNHLFSKKKTLERIYRIFDECYLVLAEEYPLEKKEKMKRNMFKNWHNIKHFSSTYQDLISGRKTEVEFFNGYIIKLAKQCKMNAEENAKLLKEFKEIENEI